MSRDKTKRCTDFQQRFNDNLDTYLSGAMEHITCVRVYYM